MTPRHPEQLELEQGLRSSRVELCAVCGEEKPIDRGGRDTSLCDECLDLTRSRLRAMQARARERGA